MQCGQREAIHLWVPCGHRGHCEDCLPDSVPKEAKLGRWVCRGGVGGPSPCCRRCWAPLALSGSVPKEAKLGRYGMAVKGAC